MPTSQELFAEVRVLDQGAGEIETRVAGLRAAVNSPELADDDREAKMTEYRAGLEEHVAKLKERDAKRAEAGALLDAEDWQAQANVAKNADTRAWTPEQKELRALAQDSGLIDFLGPIIQGNRVDGKADEYRKAIWPGGYPVEWVPLEFLLDRSEMLGNPPELRADTLLNQSSQEGAATTATRVFATGDAAFMGAAMPTVNAGDYNYPVITGGNATAAAAGTPGTEVAATAATVSLGTATPEWIPASVDVSVTSLIRHPGLEDAFRRELTGQLMEGVDNKAIDDLLASLTAGTDLSAQATVANYVAGIANGVDGRYALRMEDVRLLLGAVASANAPGAYSHAAQRVQANIGFGFQVLPMSQLRASAHIAAPDATHDQPAIQYKMGRPAPNSFVVPMWRGVQMIRDASTSKREGIVEITASLLMDAVAPRGNNGPYDALSFRTA